MKLKEMEELKFSISKDGASAKIDRIQETPSTHLLVQFTPKNRVAEFRTKK